MFCFNGRSLPLLNIEIKSSRSLCVIILSSTFAILVYRKKIISTFKKVLQYFTPFFLKFFAQWSFFNNVFDVNRRYSEKTPLEWAIEGKDIVFLQSLLNNNELDVNNFSDLHAKCPLQLVFGTRDREFIELFLRDNRLKFGLWIKDRCLKSPLICCIEEQDLLATELLLLHNIQNIDKEHEKKTPFQWAVEGQCLDVISLFLNCTCVDVNKEYFFSSGAKIPLEWAIDLKNIKLIKLFLDHERVNVNPKRPYSPLEIVMAQQDINSFSLILNHPRVKIDQQYGLFSCPLTSTRGTHLYRAIKNGDVEIVAEFIKSKKIDVNKYICLPCSPDVTILNVAFEKENGPIVNMLTTVIDIDRNIHQLYWCLQKNWCKEYIGKNIIGSRPLEAIRSYMDNYSMDSKEKDKLKFERASFIYSKVQLYTVGTHVFMFLSCFEKFNNDLKDYIKRFYTQVMM